MRPNSSPAEEHRGALREQQRSKKISFLPLPEFHDVLIVRRPLRAMVPRLLSEWPSRLSSPLASLCFWSYETRSFNVNPSCAVMKFTLAQGLRPRRLNRSPDALKFARQGRQACRRRPSSTISRCRDSGHSIRPNPGKKRRPDSRLDRYPTARQ